jgi:hypothetical protein
LIDGALIDGALIDGALIDGALIDGASIRQPENQMSYRLIVWSTAAWIALCVTPYLYALNELITWR